jgi:hypothetical protein
MDPMIDPLDREIGHALAVDPSPDFVARVRARIADDPSPVSGGVGWKVTGVALAASILAAAVMLRPEPRPAPETPSLLASRSIDPPIVVPTAARSKTSHEATKSVTVASVAEATVILVDQREADAIRAFMEGARTDRIELTPVAQAPAPAIMEPAPLRDILIPPIDFGLPAGSPEQGVER